MRMSTVLTATLAACAAAATLDLEIARAQPAADGCWLRPSDPIDCENPPPPRVNRVATVEETADAEAEPEAAVRQPRTHGVLFSTGHMLRAGQVQASLRAYGLWPRLAVGIHRRVELSGELVILDGEANAAALGARVSLTDPSSPLRVLVAASVWSADDESVARLQLSAVLGYQLGRFNLHAGITELANPDDDRIVGATVGALYEASSRVGLGIDAGRIGHGDDGIGGVAVGLKLMWKHVDLDLAVIAGENVPPIPIVNLTGRT